jgi:hypothetical protein
VCVCVYVCVCVRARACGRVRILELRHALLRKVRIDWAREDDVPCGQSAARRCAAVRVTNYRYYCDCRVE